MDAESLEEYVASAKSIIKDSPQMGEATTKATLLSDFINRLGWEIPKNTQLEYSVKALGRVFKVDYALTLDGRPVAFLEAKGLDSTLTSKHREQLSEYMRSEDVNWGILTNGQKYEFHHREVVETNVKVDLIADSTLGDLKNMHSIIEAYCKKTIQQKESEAIIEQIRDLQDSYEILRSQKEELATAVVDTLTQSISSALKPNAESQAKEMMDRLMRDIESQINTDTPGRGTPTPGPVDSDEVEVPLTESYSVEIVQDGNVIQTFANSVQSELIASVADYLIQNYHLISAIEPLPYIPGKNRAILNDSPNYNGTVMVQPRELVSGFYLEVNLNWIQKVREMKRLANICGLEIIVD